MHDQTLGVKVPAWRNTTPARKEDVVSMKDRTYTLMTEYIRELETALEALFEADFADIELVGEDKFFNDRDEAVLKLLQIVHPCHTCAEHEGKTTAEVEAATETKQGVLLSLTKASTTNQPSPEREMP